VNTRVIVRMASGAEHEITLPTVAAERLIGDLEAVWSRRRVGPSHTLHLPGGTSVTINPHHVEAVERH